MSLPLKQEAPEQNDPEASHRVCIYLLDGFEVRCGNEVILLPASVQRLISLLAVQNRPLRRVFIAGTLWPDSSEDRAAANLRSTLWRLRRVPHRLVEALASKLRVAPGVAVDAGELCDRATRLIQGTEPVEADVERIARVGELLPDWYDDWLLVERERFRQLRLHALEVMCLRLATTERFALAVEAGLAAVAGEPLRESAHRCLIRAHLAEGNVGEAMRQYETYRDLMRAELNLDPSPDIVKLIQDELNRGRKQTSDQGGTQDSPHRANVTITIP
jgi:DNA-binding SARP family transcriptional activator